MTELLEMMKFKEINVKRTMMLKIYLIHQVNRIQISSSAGRNAHTFVSTARLAVVSTKIWFHQTSCEGLNYHRERLKKLTFRALALRQSE